MELKDFKGKYQLQGVDEFTGTVKTWGDNFEDCSAIRFKLDGIVYVAIEDPDDGYRSYLGELKIDEVDTKNPFTGVEVLASHRDQNSYGEVSDIIDFLDTTTGRVVLSVGTGNTDDYYPYFVAYFDPTAMSINNVTEEIK